MNYYRRLSSVDHLYDAWKKLPKKKHSCGFDQETIESFGTHLDENLRKLSSELRNRTFEFNPLRGVLIDKPGGGKRPLRVPSVRDRVVMKAVQILLAPKFRKFDLPCSFGYIRRVSTANAIREVRKLASEGKVWVLEGDIHSFFDSVDQSLLIDRFLKEIRIPSLQDLVSRALKVEVGNVFAFSPLHRDLFPRADSGIPQGGVLSPLLANFYLYPFDKAMTDAGFSLVRYADDFVVMCESVQRAEVAYNTAKTILEGQLHLTLHPLGPSSKTKITLYSKGFSFLGLQFQGTQVRPCAKAVAKFRERVSDIADARHGYNLFSTLAQLKLVIEGWGHAYASYDSREEFESMDRHIREAISSYLRQHDFMKAGQVAGNHQMKILGLPSLQRIRDRVLPREEPRKPTSPLPRVA
jgi:RNA-directed DNA polymerase